MRDVGAVIWVLIVIVGVVSSIVKSAKRAQGVAPPAVPRQAPRPVRPPPPQQAARPVRPLPPQLAALMQQFEAAATPVAAAPIAPPPPVSPAPPAPPAAVRAEPAPHVRPLAAERPRRVERLLGDRSALVRGIIAAEVLGKPIALRDE